MDSTITALAIVGFAIGVKRVGSFIARRRGLKSETRWDEITDSFRIFAIRAGLTFTASGFYGFIAAAALRFAAQRLFSITLSDSWALILFGLPVAIMISMILWPKTSKIAR